MDPSHAPKSAAAPLAQGRYPEAVDPRRRAVYARISSDHFATLVRSIVSQQISSKAALAISAGSRKSRALSAEATSSLPSEDDLRAPGCRAANSGRCVISPRNVWRRRPLKKLAGMEDAEIVEA